MRGCGGAPTSAVHHGSGRRRHRSRRRRTTDAATSAPARRSLPPRRLRPRLRRYRLQLPAAPRIQSGLGLDDISDTGNTIRNQIEHTIDPDGNIGEAFKEDYSAVEEDGPYADNSFEEDEDLDGADFAEAEAMENEFSEPGDPVEIATAEVGDKEGPEGQEEIPSQAVKKAD